jgi:hypothetical protein
MLTHVRPNAAGADTRDGTQLNLNGEYFVIKNVTTRTINTSGYIPDITTNTYGRGLPAYYLPAGAKAYVHTGSGRHYRDSTGAHHIYRGYARRPYIGCRHVTESHSPHVRTLDRAHRAAHVFYLRRDAGGLPVQAHQ